VPIGGALSMFIGGKVPVGVGFEWSASTEFASFTAGARADARADARAGIECIAPAGCGFVHDISNDDLTVTPVVELPGIGDQRLASKLKVFGYLEGEFGSPLLRSLRFKAFEARVGGTLDGKFAPPVAQVLDAAFAADYKALLYGSAQVSTGIDALIRTLSLGSLRKLGLERDTPLAGTPKLVSALSDRASFALGDAVNVSVLIDPATLNFLPGQYNVESVELRRTFSGITSVIASLPASAGQSRFDFDVVAPHAGDAHEWHVFVTTRLLPFELLSLEAGRVAAGGAPSVLVESSSTMADLAGPAAPCFGRAIRTRLQNGRSDVGEMAFVGPLSDGRTHCQASVPGVSASLIAERGLSGPPVSTTPVTALPVSYAGKAELMEQLQLEITDPAAAWQQSAAANTLVEVQGGWVFQASDAPLAYTVTLHASGDAGALLTMEVTAQGEDPQSIRLCPRNPVANTTFATNLCSDSSDALGAVATRTMSGILPAGRVLGIKAQGMLNWEGYTDTTQFGAARVGESGSLRSSGSMTFEVTFSAP
jgi:hypothetical protein